MTLSTQDADRLVARMLRELVTVRSGLESLVYELKSPAELLTRAAALDPKPETKAHRIADRIATAADYSGSYSGAQLSALRVVIVDELKREGIE